MNSLANYLNHAELALAAYADLSPSMSKFQYEEALKQNGKGMSATQAADFASRWHVLEQSPDTPDGFSAVLLQQVDGNGVPVGEKVLAIRGTDGRQFKILISVEPQPAVSCHATAIVHGRPTTRSEEHTSELQSLMRT